MLKSLDEVCPHLKAASRWWGANWPWGCGSEGLQKGTSSENDVLSRQISVICGVQHAHAESEIPVVFCAVFLEVFSGHAFCGTLLEFHLPKTTLFSCALENQEVLLG